MTGLDSKILVTWPSMPSYEEYVEEIIDLWETRWITNSGEKSKKLQEMMEDYLEVDHVELVVNGHMALELALQSMKLRGEVITTPFTFASTAHAIVRSGLTPVFCDIDPYDYTMDADKIEDLITDKTCAILPVHVYGNICDVEKIQKIADNYHLKVIYDGAHAFGVKYNGRGITTYGDATCMSMHATKVFNTIEGGAICFKDKKFGENIRCMRNFGIVSEDEVDYIGTNGKMNEFSAAMGICNMEHIQHDFSQRKRCVEIYRRELQDVDGIQLIQIRDGVEENYAYFPIVVDEDIFPGGRDTVLRKLQQYGVFARKYFYPIINEMACYRKRYHSDDTPVAKYVGEHVLTLPLYVELEDEQIEFICKIIKSCRNMQSCEVLCR